MAPVKLKYVVSFTSQDDNHKASNLISGGGMKKWLCHPKDRNGRIEIIIQLEDATQFSFVDIGTIWCASLEINVGNSDWPLKSEYKKLVPMVTLMSPIDSQLGRKTTNAQMFTPKDFSNAVGDQKWDRIQIICRQPYRKDQQLGISFIRIRSSDKGVSNPSSSSKENDEGKKSLHEKNLVDIKKHFFGESRENKELDEDLLKQRLLQMSGSSDNGCVNLHEESLSRTAQLVINARDKANKSNAHYTVTSNQSKRGLFSDANTNKTGLTLDEEMAAFLPTLNLSMVDFDTVTVADLRHKFERKKRRKLSPPERRKFSEQCQQFMWNLSENDTSQDQKSCTKDCTSSSLSSPISSSKQLDCLSQKTVGDGKSKQTEVNPAFCSPSSVKLSPKQRTENKPSVRMSPAAVIRKQNRDIRLISDNTSHRQSSRSSKNESKERASSSESNNDGSDICYNSTDNSDTESITIDDSSPTRKPQIKRKLQTLDDINKSYKDLYKTFTPEKLQGDSFTKRKQTNSKRLKVYETEPCDDEVEKNGSCDSCSTSWTSWLSAVKTPSKTTAAKFGTKRTPVASKPSKKSISQGGMKFDLTTDVPKSELSSKTFRWSSASEKKVSSHQGQLLERLAQVDKYFSNTVTSGSSSLLCKTCGFLIPQDTYAAHCTSCCSPAKGRGHETDRPDKTLPSGSTRLLQNGGSVKRKSSAIDLTLGGLDNDVVDLTQIEFPMCPICLKQFPQEVLMAHASECGL